MSQLTEALERISSWLQAQTSSDYFSFLQPGLSDSEIQELTKDLPFNYPPEISEFYQWKNGSIDDADTYQKSAYFLPTDNCQPYGFWSLKTAVSRYWSKLKCDRSAVAYNLSSQEYYYHDYYNDMYEE